MSTAAESTKTFAAELATRLAADNVADGQLAWLGKLRENAAARFAELGFPGARDEDWKYTSAGPVLRHVYRSALDSTPVFDRDAVVATINALDPAPASAVAVFVDGVLTSEFSRGLTLDGNVVVGGLREHLERAPQALEGRLGRTFDGSVHGFAALNSAHLSDGAVVRISRGTAGEAPIHLVFFSTAGGEQQAIAAHPRNLIVLEAGSSACVVEHYAGEPGVHLTNAATESVLERDASLSHLKLQREAEEAFHVHRIQVHQDVASSYVSHSIALGAQLSRTEIHVTLAGEEAQCALQGLYAVGGTAHVDHHTTIDHAVARTHSRELYKGILDGQSRGVFTGKVRVRRDAQQISAEQTNKSLLLADGAVAETRPQLEIYADDVKCSHGAAIGRLDEEALFYLRQRGIGEAEARSLMTYAFGNEVVETIEIGALAATLEAIVREQIGSAARGGKGA
ncbi:MAG: Fe-S cluster assembly protein SufD [Candidatus Binatia bacterium]